MNLQRNPNAKFDHEKLDVYRFELDFIEWVTPLLDEATASAKGRTREVCDQLDRASLSVLLNTAEGNGKRQRPVRANFLTMHAARRRNVPPAWMRSWPRKLYCPRELIQEKIYC